MRKSVAFIIIALLGTAPVFAEPSTASDIVSVQSTTSNPTSTISSQTSSENANSSEILSNMLSSNTDPDSNIDSSLVLPPKASYETSSALWHPQAIIPLFPVKLPPEDQISKRSRYLPNGTAT